jgi:hypothetical protein
MSWTFRASLAPDDCLLVKMHMRGVPATLDGLVIEDNMAIACNGYIWARRIIQAPSLIRPPFFIRSKYIKPYLKNGARVNISGNGKQVQLESYDERIRTTEFAVEHPAHFGVTPKPPGHIVESISDWTKSRETLNRVVEEKPPVFKDIPEIGISPRVLALLASILPNHDNWRGHPVVFRIRKPSLAIEFSCGELVGLFMPNETSLIQSERWLFAKEENDG